MAKASKGKHKELSDKKAHELYDKIVELINQLPEKFRLYLAICLNELIPPQIRNCQSFFRHESEEN